MGTVKSTRKKICRKNSSTVRNAPSSPANRAVRSALKGVETLKSMIKPVMEVVITARVESWASDRP